MAGEGKEECVETEAPAAPAPPSPETETAPASADAVSDAPAPAPAPSAADVRAATTRIFNVARKRYTARFGGTDEARGRYVFFNKVTTHEVVELEAAPPAEAAAPAVAGAAAFPQVTMCPVFSLHHDTVADVCNDPEKWVMDRIPLEVPSGDDDAEDDTAGAPAPAVSYLNVIMDPQTARDIDGANPQLRKSKTVVTFKNTAHILCIVTTK